MLFVLMMMSIVGASVGIAALIRITSVEKNRDRIMKEQLIRKYVSEEDYELIKHLKL